jgi:hypothetical protein
MGWVIWLVEGDFAGTWGKYSSSQVCKDGEQGPPSALAEFCLWSCMGPYLKHILQLTWNLKHVLQLTWNLEHVLQLTWNLKHVIQLTWWIDLGVCS